jgi:hypothetical protein
MTTVLHHNKLREHDGREESYKSAAKHRRKWNDNTNIAELKNQIDIDKFTLSPTNC